MEQPVLKTEILYDQLRQELEKYTPGEKFITSREIMKRFNVSQLVVDQTMSRFRTTGLLKTVPGRGTFVTANVGRFHSVAPPTLLFAMPRWNSSDNALIDGYLQKMQTSDCQYRLLVHYYDYSERVPVNLPIREENVKGVAMMTSSDCWDAQTLARLEAYAAELPLVLLGRRSGDIPLLSVGYDNTLSGAMAADYLYNCGHRNIAVLCSEPHNSAITERVRGAVNYAMLRNMECRVLDCFVRSGEYSPDKAYRYFEQQIQTGFDFTALIGVGLDSLAGAVNACLNAGLKVPDDLSVVTIGPWEVAKIQHPPFDCVGTEMSQVLSKVLDLLQHPDRYTPENNPYVFCRPDIARNGSVRMLP